jgi:hypothetical protein
VFLSREGRAIAYGAGLAIVLFPREGKSPTKVGKIGEADLCLRGWGRTHEVAAPLHAKQGSTHLAYTPLRLARLRKLRSKAHGGLTAGV